MSADPLISIVTVVYNGEKTLEQTIQSVLNQTYPNIEYIIIDGGSADATPAIIKKYESRLAYWISEPDKGIYHAMNKGIEKCKGELIGIVNSDDWYEAHTAELVAQRYIEEGSRAGVYYGFLKLWKDGKEHTIRRFHHNFPREHMIQHPTWFVARKIYDEVGKFDDSYRIAGDFELLQRLVRNRADFFPIDAILSNFRIGGVSTYAGLLTAREYLRIKYELGWMNMPGYLKQKVKFWIKELLTADKAARIYRKREDT